MKGSIAQLVEHRTFNPQVPGSSPGGPTIQGNSMDNYTIMEYNTKTGEYLTIGYAEGLNAEHAKIMFLKRNKWQPLKHILLHAKLPACG